MFVYLNDEQIFIFDVNTIGSKQSYQKTKIDLDLEFDLLK